MKIAIVNIGRFGDIIQSYPLVNGLKKKFKDCIIYYILLQNFLEPAKLIKDIDYIFPIDFSKTLKNIDENNLDNAFLKLKKILSPLEKEVFDLVINLSFSQLSAILTYFLKAEDKRGLFYSENNELFIKDKWSRFFVSIVDFRNYSPFNIVDIFCKIGGVNPEKIKIVQPKKIEKIGFQLGASTSNRRWPVKYFSQLAKLILKRDNSIKIYIFGSKSEKILENEFFSYFSHPNIVSLIGKTSIIDLSEILKDEIDILISNDTGTMHLAWFNNKKVIELSLGPALFQTTSPYGEGHIVFQPDIHCCPCSYHVNCLNFKCHNLITPEDVISAIFEENNFSENIKVFKTTYDNKNFLTYKNFLTDSIPENFLILKDIWLTLMNDEKIEINDFSRKIFDLIKIIEKIEKSENFSEINSLIDLFELNEKLLKEKIFSEKSYLVPFFKFYEYSKFDLEENDKLNSIKKLKNNLLKLQYAINKFS